MRGVWNTATYTRLQRSEVLRGTRKIEDFGKEDAKKDEVKAAPPK